MLPASKVPSAVRDQLAEPGVSSLGEESREGPVKKEAVARRHAACREEHDSL
jgi:hypothetical protein